MDILEFFTRLNRQALTLEVRTINGITTYRMIDLQNGINSNIQAFEPMLNNHIAGKEIFEQQIHMLFETMRFPDQVVE